MREELAVKTLTLFEDDGRQSQRTFRIHGVMPERGGSSICYEASYKTSGKGILKEFYPRDNKWIKRGPEGQLMPAGKKGSEAWPRFEQDREAYLEPYRSIQKLRRRDTYATLATFISSFELYYGPGQTAGSGGTAYIWTPDPKLTTFQEVCDSIRQNPKARPEYKLALALRAVVALAECVQVLHKEGLLHRDIKPGNFGFKKRGNRILPETLTMFDLNSVCFADADRDAAVGSAGYRDPEPGRQDNRSDIYSIGATLFSAIIVTDGARSVYSPEQFGRLKELVDNSQLIQASEINAHPRLRAALTEVLRRCLCPREERYANCEELREGLRKALHYVMPDMLSDIKAEEKWVLEEREKAEHADRAIPGHLYRNPLYRWGPKGANVTNVLVIGFGNYGQKFFEYCLQVGQVRDRKLNVTVISKDSVDQELYLQDRPELAKFFQVEGMEADLTGEAYGAVRFETRALSGKETDRAADRDVLEDIIYSNESTHYIFIALGDDSRNLHAAEVCQKIIDDYGLPCCVNFVWEGEEQEAPGALWPVYVGRRGKRTVWEREIDRMAFNVHLLWQKNLNLDYKLLRREFRVPYNYRSCAANVLSLSYKLYSIGIDLDCCGPELAAERFREKLREPGVEDELAYLEHRRWVTEKICDGWQGIEDLANCSLDGAKDQTGKRHACIRRSRPDHLLADWDLIQWDKKKLGPLDELDELDRMSVELHRIQWARAKLAKRKIDRSQIDAIGRLAEQNPETWAAFQEWSICLNDIWDENQDKAVLYRGLSDALSKAAAGLEQKETLRDHLKSFHKQFQALLAGQEYQNYKQIDMDLIQNIPFILTYSTDICLAIPLTTGSSDAIFSNLAAVTVVNPARIIFFYLKNSGQREGLSEETRSCIRTYLDKKNLRAAVEFLLLEGDIQQAGRQLRQALENGRKGRRLLAVERKPDCGRLSQVVEQAGIYNEFPHYRFDLDHQSFDEISGCAALGYIPNRPYITAADIIAFRQAARERGEEPEFFGDYAWLWNVYCRNTIQWKLLCDALKKWVDNEKNVTVFTSGEVRKGGPELPMRNYLLPPACWATANRLLAVLKKKDADGRSAIGEDSWVYARASACEVKLYAGEENQAAFQRLLIRPDLLAVPDALDWYHKGGQLYVDQDSLRIERAKLKSGSGFGAPGRMEEKERLLEEFRKKGYIYGLSLEEDHIVSFTFATRQIKHLLVTAGNILEVYVYHALRRSGLFDDVVSSTVISRNENGKENEFDCIATKGFRSLFIECKAKNYMNPEVYQELEETSCKLAGLVERFGVNAKAVLLLDSGRPPKAGELERLSPSGITPVFLWRDDIRKPEEEFCQTLLDILTGGS